MLTVDTLIDLLSQLPGDAEVVACTDDLEVVIDEETFYIRASSSINEDDNEDFLQELKTFLLMCV